MGQDKIKELDWNIHSCVCKCHLSDKTKIQFIQKKFFKDPKTDEEHVNLKNPLNSDYSINLHYFTGVITICGLGG